MRLFYLMFFFCPFVSCVLNTNFLICDNLPDLAGVEKLNAGKVLVLLQGEEEKIDKRELCEIYKLFHSKFLCVEASDSLSIVFKKILCYPKKSVFLVVKYDSLYSVITYKGINDLKSSIIASNCTLCSIDKYFNMSTINSAFSKVINKENLFGSKRINYDINESYFYNDYLLALYYRNNGRYDLAENIYSKLWRCSTKEEREMYPEEYLDIVRNKDYLIKIDNEDLIIDKKNIDFGNIRLGEKKRDIITIVNNSGKPFVIKTIYASCGCTVVSWNRKPINSLKKDSIIVDFKPVDLGVNVKSISIIGNSEDRINVTIRSYVVE